MSSLEEEKEVGEEKFFSVPGCCRKRTNVKCVRHSSLRLQIKVTKRLTRVKLTYSYISYTEKKRKGRTLETKLKSYETPEPKLISSTTPGLPKDESDTD